MRHHNVLDFVVIGAQKCGTTALHEMLAVHPDLTLPANKEAPWFDAPDRPFEHYLDENFGPHKTGIWGKVTPQYMSHSDIAPRLHAMNPDLRIIALVRDPVSRTLSHYRMARRRETESRDFSDAIREQLAPIALLRGRHRAAPRHTNGYESEADFYIPWSEYGRILLRYGDVFSRRQILVLDQTALRRNPARTYQRVCRFLNVRDDILPGNLNKEIHKGGDAPLINRRTKEAILRLPLIRRVWESVPQSRRHTLRYWLEQKNVRASAQDIAVDARSKARLVAHFARDAQLLAPLCDELPPWMDQYLPDTTLPNCVAECKIGDSMSLTN